MGDLPVEMRRELTFAQAEGAEPLPAQLRLGEVYQEMRAKLWNMIYQAVPRATGTTREYLFGDWEIVLRDKHV